MYIATSVDGYIAGPDGDISWLHRPEYSGRRLSGIRYDDFIADVDTIIMGRKSYEKALEFEDWPYKTPIVVLTSRDVPIPEKLQPRVSTDAGHPADIIARRACYGDQHLYIDGGETIRRFLLAGKINELTITRIPIILGGGTTLFDALGKEIPLQLIGANVSENGLVQVRYRLDPKP